MIQVLTQAKIKTKPLAFDFKDKEKTDQFIQSLNYVPFLFLSKVNDPIVDPEKKVDGNTIDAKDVVYVKLYNNKFLPSIELSCFDSSGIFFSDLYPYDHDTILSIFVKSNSELLMPIRMDFRITEFSTSKGSSDDFKLKYLIRGILDVDALQYTRYEARLGTSFKVIQAIASELELGFASNVEDSQDEMKWINPSETYMDFIKDTTKRAYIGENSFVWSFIDFFYNINYVNIDLELNLVNAEQQTFTSPTLIKEDEESVIDLYLTNNPAFNMTNKYIDKFELNNQSYKVNLEKSYRMKSTWYDKNENKIYRTFLEDLKNTDENIKTLNDYESQIFQENINDDYYIGKLENDNVHPLYAYTKAINIFNLQSMEKMQMTVILTQINFSVKRFQNIQVEIYNINDMLSNEAGTKKAVDNINERLSGFWFVTGINYLYRRTGGVQQEITLVRRDLNIKYTQRSDFRKLEK